MNRQDDLRGRTTAAIERGDGDTERLATEWAMPFIADDTGESPTAVPFRGEGRQTRRPVSGFVVFTGRLLMTFGLLVLLLGVFGGVSALGKSAERTLQPQTIAVSGVPTVRIENAIGTVRVIAGASDRVQVSGSASVRHISRGLAQEALEGYAVDVDQDPATGVIVIKARSDKPFDGGDFFAGWMMQRSIHLTVAMPASGNLDLNVAAGQTTVEGIAGRVNAEVSAGGLDLVDTKLADGSAFKVNAGSLNFVGELQQDASIDIDVNAGSARLVLPRTTVARLEGRTEAGSISASGWPNPLAWSRSRSGSSSSSIGGNLQNTGEASKSVIRATVHAGSIDIIGRSAVGERKPAPVGPAAPQSLPPIPALP